MAKDPPRQLTVRPQAQHEAIQGARKRQETEAFKAQYTPRAGVESTLSQGVRRFDLRCSRYIGLARTQLQGVYTEYMSEPDTGQQRMQKLNNRR